jgi:hypothetical protein
MNWCGPTIAGSNLALSSLRAVIWCTICNTSETSPIKNLWIALRNGNFVSCVFRHFTAKIRSSVQVLTWCFQATKSTYEVVASCKSPEHSVDHADTAFNMAVWTPWTKFCKHKDSVHSTAVWNTAKCGWLQTVNKLFAKMNILYTVWPTSALHVVLHFTNI